MSWFSKDKPILRDSESTVILAADLDGEPGNRRVKRILFTGHDGSHGAVHGFAPATGILWQATFASEDDVEQGRLAHVGGVVVTYDPSGGVLAGLDEWTGTQRWKTPIGKLVSRLGVDRAGHLVGVTLDHVVHAIAPATGADTPRGKVMTDEAMNDLIGATNHPTKCDWQDGNRRRATAPEWSYVHELFPGLQVLQRDWAGTVTWAVGEVQEDGRASAHELGQGRYEGMIAVGDVVVAAFKLQLPGESERRHHWYIFARKPVELLGVMREAAPSEFYVQGRSVWKGRL